MVKWNDVHSKTEAEDRYKGNSRRDRTLILGAGCTAALSGSNSEMTDQASAIIGACHFHFGICH